MNAAMGSFAAAVQGTSLPDRASNIRHSILLIDDHIVARAALKATLKMRGCRVVDTGSGQDALRLLVDGLRPCMIFLDPGIPHGGAWLFRTFQLADEELATIPVAILSASDLCTATAGGLRISHWLVKPADAENIVQLVATYCGAGMHGREHEECRRGATRPVG